MNTTYANLRVLCFGIALFTLTVNAQLRPLSEYDVVQIMQNISNSEDWHTIMQQKMLMRNFPVLAPQYQRRIYSILEAYRYTLYGMIVAEEEEQWLQYLSTQKIMNTFGHVNQPTQQSIAAAQERQRNGKPPEATQMEMMQKEIDALLQEAYEKNNAVQQNDYYQSPGYLEDVPNYSDALTFIKDMLEGRRPLSIKDAYYKAEYAYGNLHLGYDEYNRLIKSNADFIRQWLTEKKYSLNNPEALHYGIQKFMSDTLFISVEGKRSGHMPYFYDYIDFEAKADKRNYFVTKTLATGTGQCHTFPVTYLILAEALGVEAWLAYSPRHSFIRYKNNEGSIINYETTVDRFLADGFYLQNLPVMAGAQKNSIYISSLSKKQVIASVLYDLGVNFVTEHWVSDRKLIKECLNTAKPHFPGREYISSSESHLQQRLLAYNLNEMVKARQIKNVRDIQKHPDIMNAYDQYITYMERVTALGVQKAPAADELRFIEYADEKGRLMKAKGINSKQKRSLFIK